MSATIFRCDFTVYVIGPAGIPSVLFHLDKPSPAQLVNADKLIFLALWNLANAPPATLFFDRPESL